jgi:hypothetical protein
MINLIPSNALPATWPQRLSSAVKTAWETTFRRPAQPVTAPPVVTGKPVLLTVQVTLPPARPDVVCLAVAGELNRHTYTTLIDMASAHYHPGRRALLLDLRQTTQIELSGLFALLSIARLYSGQPLLDPEVGWVGLHRATEEVTPALGKRVKLLAPSSAAVAALEQASFCRFFAHYPDWETALAALPSA